MNFFLKKFAYTFISAGLFLTISSDVMGQVTPQVEMFRKEPKGTVQSRRQGILDGNLVRTVYKNNAEVSDWFSGAVSAPHGEWPKNSGHRSLDGLTPLVGAKFRVRDMADSTKTRLVKTVETSYREVYDFDPDTHVQWGVEPVPGYSNPSSKIPAIDIKKTSYPEHWPRSIFYDLYGTDENQIKEWDGYWYGYFGRGVSNAQLETYFVVDDSQDKEFTRFPFGYYPVADDSERGGIGERMEVRGFQWNHVLAEDIIFWHYDIINISDHDYDSTVFGFYADPSVGSQANDALFDRKLDLAYAWDPIPFNGLPDHYQTGYYGHSFLESPGNSNNGVDDDEDALKTDGTKWADGSVYNPKMVDERRDDGIDNDMDWVPFTDVNKNGKWDGDLGEPLNDDVGADGVGVYDPQYKGPDKGEGDGLPTLGEPNFDKTDKDESDQIGLQSAFISILTERKSEDDAWPRSDNKMWDVMTGGFVDTSIRSANISMVFSSGIFPLKRNQRERFSIAILFGDNLEDLIFNKVTVQSIYNANYNFAQPPLTPTLTAVPGDHKVFLYWDNVAEHSYDRFLRKFDFEGYLLYRSEEFVFQDIKTITDSKGDPKYYKPIKQWDVVDSIKGPDPVGVNGAHFWRGDDTGLQHSFVDTTVVNGKRYYYALVSYDKGVIPNKMDSVYGPSGGLTPSECTKQITEEFNGTLTFVDINCAVVTPSGQSAGYIPPQIEGTTTKLKQGIGTGKVEVGIINPNVVREGYTYQIHFDSVGTMPLYNTKSYSVLRFAPSTTTADTVIKNAGFTKKDPVILSSPFDGLSLTLSNDTSVTIDNQATGWVYGSSTFHTNITMRATIDQSNGAKNVAWPADYEIQFFTTNQDKPALKGGKFIDDSVKFTITNLTSGYRCKFLVMDMNANGYFDYKDSIKILDGYVNSTNFKICYNLSYVDPSMNPIDPSDPYINGKDKFVLKTKKPFSTGDYFEFKTHSAKVNSANAKNALDKISVVPNPYFIQAKWERQNIFQTGRGDRKIEFIHLPAQCTIRIYTISGQLVKTLQKNSSPDNGTLSWDLISDDGMDISFGLYIFHVDAPNIGTYIGKFAVIK